MASMAAPFEVSCLLKPFGASEADSATDCHPAPIRPDPNAKVDPRVAAVPAGSAAEAATDGVGTWRAPIEHHGRTKLDPSERFRQRG